MRQPGEPSVEDILESIKQVMARDNRATAFTERRMRRDETSYAWDAGSIVPMAEAQAAAPTDRATDSPMPLERLEVTATGSDASVTKSPTAEAAPEDQGSDAIEESAEVLDLGSAGFTGETPETAAAATSSERTVEPPSSASTTEPPLVTPQAQASMRDSLATLAALSKVGIAPSATGGNATPLEGMIRELLRPMLADWLDRNLPPLVERLVAEEIARIVGKQL